MQQALVKPRLHHISFGLGSGEDFLLTAKFFAEVFGGSETRREIEPLGDGLIFHQFTGEKPQTQINWDGKNEPIPTPHIAFAVSTMKELEQLFANVVEFCTEQKKEEQKKEEQNKEEQNKEKQKMEWKIVWQSDDRKKVILSFEFLSFDIELLVSEN